MGTLTLTAPAPALTTSKAFKPEPLMAPAMFSVPALTVFVCPARSVVMSATRVSVPVPALVMSRALRLVLLTKPVSVPPTVSVLPLTVTVRLLLIVTRPAPRFKPEVPVNVKSPFQFWALLPLLVMAAPVALLKVPPLSVNMPVPSAPALLMFRVPALRVTPPLMVFTPPKARVPALLVTAAIVLLPWSASRPAPTFVTEPAPLRAAALVRLKAWESRLTLPVRL